LEIAMTKRLKYAMWAIFLIVLAMIAWEWRIVYFVVRIVMEPAECDEGKVSDQHVSNGRGDVVAAYLRACTGFGTVVDESIVLQLRGDEKATTLIKHDGLSDEYPKFRWIDDNTLSIDLGKVEWISRKVDKVGSIRITYSYTKAGTSWW
jgi:hypothetical protein